LDRERNLSAIREILPSTGAKLTEAGTNAHKPINRRKIGARWTPHTNFLLAVKAIGKNAGVPNVTLHRFCRTHGTTLFRGGMDIRTVQRLLGHGDLAFTTRYLTPLLGDDALDKFDTIYK
jgi:integrase